VNPEDAGLKIVDVVPQEDEQVTDAERRVGAEDDERVAADHYAVVEKGGEAAEILPAADWFGCPRNKKPCSGCKSPEQGKSSRVIIRLCWVTDVPISTSGFIFNCIEKNRKMDGKSSKPTCIEAGSVVK